MESTMNKTLATMGREVKACRMCGSGDLGLYLDLGHTPPADQFRRADQLAEPIASFPLQVLLCQRCGLSQLGYVVRPEILYQDEYPYEASTTQAGQRHFRGFASSVAARFGLTERDLAVDIGSNVGVLLSGFQEEGVRVAGIDPAANIAAIAEARGIPTIADFFNQGSVGRVLDAHGAARVITGTNVFAHVDDLKSFMEAVDHLMTPDGVFIFECPYFVNLLQDLEYDTIYHEHLSYVSLRPLIPFFARFGMRIFDVEEVDIHGGSFRVFVDRCRNEVNTKVIDAMLRREERSGAHDIGRLQGFAFDVAENRERLRELVFGLHSRGHRIAGVSAPAKGMTLLNYCGIGADVLEFVTEKSALKIGRYTPGGNIPVLSDDALIERRPDYALLLAWNFAGEIMRNLSDYTASGGRFILPIPEPRVVSAEPRIALARTTADSANSASERAIEEQEAA
jgi:SAM-dependent methyltransferase